MTDDHSRDSLHGQITTEEAFEAALSDLLSTALRNGIDPRGSWVCRDGETSPDMEVMVLELEDGSHSDGDGTERNTD
ncbi:MAG: hypothetical protein ABEH61_03825 [Haloarculaceae archaeon]